MTPGPLCPLLLAGLVSWGGGGKRNHPILLFFLMTHSGLWPVPRVEPASKGPWDHPQAWGQQHAMIAGQAEAAVTKTVTVTEPWEALGGVWPGAPLQPGPLPNAGLTYMRVWILLCLGWGPLGPRHI